ncbi:MAG: hypothetical protein ABL940_05085 [Bacteroidia bacterium]
MNKLKSLWTSFIGSISSATPLLFACCKSGACVGVCASPVTSLFGISSATFANSPLFNAFIPLLIALSAVSFTVSYYSLYVLPKFSNCSTDCNCETPNNKSEKWAKFIFWVGLSASVFFFTYFEIQKYNVNNAQKLCGTTMESVNVLPMDTTKTECCTVGTTCD